MMMASAVWIASLSHAAAMGSGPHPTVAFGIPSNPVHGAPGAESIPIEWIIFYLLTLVLLIGTLRAFLQWRRPKYLKPRSRS